LAISTVVVGDAAGLAASGTVKDGERVVLVMAQATVELARVWLVDSKLTRLAMLDTLFTED
jgi:hypothetical protein